MNELINKKIKNSYEVVNAAIEGFTKQIAANLKLCGKKRCGATYVWQHGTRDYLNYANFYQNFLQWITAIFYAKPAGFELLYTDLQIFVSELQRRKLKNLTGEDLTQNPGFPARREIFFELIKMQSSLNALKGELGLEVVR